MIGWHDGMGSYWMVRQAFGGAGAFIYPPSLYTGGRLCIIGLPVALDVLVDVHELGNVYLHPLSYPFLWDVPRLPGFTS